ncbi:hypothetical protein VTL71DRAFT_4060 [Oculimacula yallundae]|uniref:Uncharacterized protein n=1 Tax=Oculimacula yallundae TaxID=86028 RepID=A0ABR4C4Q7_9HELO
MYSILERGVAELLLFWSRIPKNPLFCVWSFGYISMIFGWMEFWGWMNERKNERDVFTRWTSISYQQVGSLAKEQTSDSLELHRKPASPK